MAQGILVFIEQRGGHIKKSALEALSEAQRLIGKVGGELTAAIVGDNVKGLSGEISKYKAGKIFVVDNNAFANYSSDGYAKALAAAIEKAQPAYVFASHTAIGKDLMPKVAARLDAPIATDVVEFKSEGNALLVVKPMYSAKTYGTYEFSAPTVFITLRPNRFPINGQDAGNQAQVEDLSVSADIRAKVVETHAAEGQKVDVSEASIIVSGGRGIKGPENWGVLQSLCDVLGAGLGASRAVVDAGWIDHQHQVGQTGKTVSPQLYIACGISGAIQHLAGMSSSKVIVAINKDPEAPIFKHATYGLVGDVLEIVPKLTTELKSLNGKN